MDFRKEENTRIKNRTFKRKQLSIQDFDDLAAGSWVLGTGGGGDPYHGLLNIKNLLKQGKKSYLISANCLKDDDMIGVCGQMGAPLVSQERITDPKYTAESILMMENYIGRPLSALMSVEIGGGNAFQPFLAGALLGKPVVDGDAMGRAFPAAQHTSFAVGELGSVPFSLCDIRKNHLLITESESWTWIERISRSVCTELGARGFNCKAPRTGREVKDWGVLGSVTQALRIGRTLRLANDSKADPVSSLVESEDGILLFRGKIMDVFRRMTKGYLTGKLVIQSIDCEEQSEFVIEFQNEYLVGYHNKKLVASVPELICLLDSSTGHAIGSETVRYGQRVSVILLRSSQVFLSDAGLCCSGPTAFGYDFKFISAFDHL